MTTNDEELFETELFILKIMDKCQDAEPSFIAFIDQLVAERCKNAIENPARGEARYDGEIISYPMQLSVNDCCVWLVQTFTDDDEESDEPIRFEVFRNEDEAYSRFAGNTTLDKLDIISLCQ